MPAEPDRTRDMRGFRRVRRADREVGVLAGAQHGVVAQAQLLGLGLSGDEIEWRLRVGRLHRLHRGVYAVGHAGLTKRGVWMAAVLAGGPDAFLTHRSAAALHGVRSSGQVEVTAPTERRSKRITFHEGRIPPDERTVIDGIPTTGIHRTLLDLAAVVPADHLRRAFEEAERQRLTDGLPLAALIARHRGRRGVATLRAIADERASNGAVTRSELESRFLHLVAQHRLPRPQTNVLIQGQECDAVWPARALIVELDGQSTHHTTAAFERDRARDRRLQARGWRVIRLTWRQLHDERAAVVADLRTALRSTA